MTEQVQKIREEVVRMHNLLPVMDGDNISVNYADRICTTLEMYIDSLREEPVSKDKFVFKALPRLLEMLEPNDRAKAYTNRLADALEKEGYNTDAKIVREKIRVMNGETVAMATMDEEPVSDDLEQAIDTYLATYFGGEKEKQDWPFLKKMAIHFANWQKQQFEKNRLKHCNSITNEQAELEQGFIDQHLDKHQRMPTFLDAIEYGIKLMKEQMMKDAVEVTVHIDAGNYPYIPQMELYDYDKDVPLAKEGDKYKVILIKEDR